MKYNTKIKNLFFFGLVAIIFCLPLKKALAVNVCGSAKVPPFGECQTLYCSSGFEKDTGDLTTCSVNSFATLCCKPITPVATDSMTSCVDASGRKGNCEFGACSEGLDPTPIQSTDCWLGRNCCAPKVETTPIATASSISNLGSTNTGLSSEPYQNPSLIRCNNNKGLCYDKKSGGCPSGVTAIAGDTICGTAYDCCAVSTGVSCGAGNVCVDENVICINVISGANCSGGQKCCAEKIPQSTVNSNSDPVIVKADNAVAYESQCSSTNSDGTQSGCSTTNNSAILANQCQNLFTAAECTSMSNYLASLTNKCLQMKPAGIKCEMINSGGFYGNEASKFANYYMQNSSSTSTTSGQSVGGLDFDSIAALGVPDNPGGVKGILTNIVKWMLGIITLITFIAFIISGGQYLMASGDDKMIETAKKNMTYSVIGILVALSGFIVIRAVDAALRATNMF